jgi:cysteine desulfurase
VQLANNETGVIQPVSELVELAHSAGAFFHCDAVQALGKMPFSLVDLGVDSAAFSAHKVHGPKGVGFLYLRSGANRFPFPKPLAGGGQERGVRPGTHNVPGIVGLAKAMELLPDQIALEKMQRLRDEFEAATLTAIPGCRINGAGAERLPNTTNLFVPGIPSDFLMDNIPLFCVSNGSACNTGAIEPSYVLQAMRLPLEDARNCIRISTSISTSKSELRAFIDAICAARRDLP